MALVMEAGLLSLPQNNMKLDKRFFGRSAQEVAPGLIGCRLCVRQPDGTVRKLVISETEIYFGESDTACHAHKGRTKRTEPLYREGGTIYVYLCYGIHWLINIVTGSDGDPQCVLIRACESCSGPAKLTKYLGIDKRFNMADITADESIWIESDADAGRFGIMTCERIGIGYASQKDQRRPWRFVLQPKD